MKFRKANQRDVDSLQAFSCELADKKTVFGHTLGREFFKSMIRTGLVYLAENDTKNVVGCLVANADARIQVSNIVHLSTHPETGNSTIVEGLLDKHFDECKKMNISDVALHTADVGKDNLAMYDNLGFAQEKQFTVLTKQVDW